MQLREATFSVNHSSKSQLISYTFGTSQISYLGNCTLPMKMIQPLIQCNHFHVRMPHKNWMTLKNMDQNHDWMFSYTCHGPKYFFKPWEKSFLFWRICQNIARYLLEGCWRAFAQKPSWPKCCKMQCVLNQNTWQHKEECISAIVVNTPYSTTEGCLLLIFLYLGWFLEFPPLCMALALVAFGPECFTLRQHIKHVKTILLAWLQRKSGKQTCWELSVNPLKRMWIKTRVVLAAPCKSL